MVTHMSSRASGRVADAKVVAAVDRSKDLLVDEPREDLPPENEGGNCIVLDLGKRRYAAYAHLQAGSVTVKPGDRVKHQSDWEIIAARLHASGWSYGIASQRTESGALLEILMVGKDQWALRGYRRGGF